MVPKAKILVLFNTLLSIPLAIYLIAWLLAALVAAGRAEGAVAVIVFLLLFLIFIFVSSIYAAVRLKVRILKEIGDPDLAPVQTIYRSASRVNLGAYALYYPLLLSLFSPAGAFLGVPGGVFLGLTLVAAIPLRLLINRRSRAYEMVRASYSLGLYRCPSCRVSLAYVGPVPRWACFRCDRSF